ncbi:MAG TPA: hypothetical protein VGG97_22670 [Bryobacteraceae bacterium]|jgi:hypothetical protein
MSAEIFAGRKAEGGERLLNALGTPPLASGIRDQKDTKQILKTVALFYGIACGFAWFAWTPLVLGPAGLKLHKHAVSLPVSACIGTLGPLLACFISHRVQAGNWRAVRLIIVVGLSTVMAFAFNASGEAVVVAILMHSAFNAAPKFIPGFLGSVPTREHPSSELLLGFSFLPLAAAPVIFTRSRLFADAK